MDFAEAAIDGTRSSSTKAVAQSFKDEWTGNAFDFAFNQLTVSTIPRVRILLPEPISKFSELLVGEPLNLLLEVLHLPHVSPSVVGQRRSRDTVVHLYGPGECEERALEGRHKLGVLRLCGVDSPALL